MTINVTETIIYIGQVFDYFKDKQFIYLNIKYLTHLYINNFSPRHMEYSVYISWNKFCSKRLNK